MSVDTDPVDVDKRKASGQLLHRRLVVGQRIVAHVAVTIVVVPLGTAGMASTLTDGDHDETGLCQTVSTHAHTGKRIIDSLYLRPRIYIVDNRIDLGGIEIKRLVHHSVQIGHAIGGLHLEEFGKTVARQFQLREITFLDGHHLVSVAVYHIGTRHRIHPRIIIHEKTCVVCRLHLMEIVSLRQPSQTASVGIHSVKVFIIGILVLLTPVRHEIDGTGGLIHLQHTFHMPRSRSDPVLQISLVVIQIQMRPSVTLTPLDEFLASVEHMNRTRFLIGIHPFLHNRNDGILTDSIGAHIYAMKVTAAAGQEETGVVALPDKRDELLIPLLLPERLEHQI